jgi:hypothetical protein
MISYKFWVVALVVLKSLLQKSPRTITWHTWDTYQLSMLSFSSRPKTFLYSMCYGTPCIYVTSGEKARRTYKMPRLPSFKSLQPMHLMRPSGVLFSWNHLSKGLEIRFIWIWPANNRRHSSVRGQKIRRNIRNIRKRLIPSQFFSPYLAFMSVWIFQITKAFPRFSPWLYVLSRD